MHSTHRDAAVSTAEGAGIVVGTIGNDGPKGECAQHSMQIDAVETNKAKQWESGCQGQGFRLTRWPGKAWLMKAWLLTGGGSETVYDPVCGNNSAFL